MDGDYIDNPNYERSFCSEFEERGYGDMHGGHTIVTGGFENVHITHVELSRLGQPTLARYPLHWHMVGEVGHNAGYEDPTYFESNSIHRSFSRFVTVHAANGTRVADNVGYDSVGHGYFLEDGIEVRNTFEHNLGMVIRPGIILPSDRSTKFCTKTGDAQPVNGPNGWEAQNAAKGCGGGSVFWISNIQNDFNNNAAVGGDTCYWLIPHIFENYTPPHPYHQHVLNQLAPWTKNKASACNKGLFVEDRVCEECPFLDKYENVAKFGIIEGQSQKQDEIVTL